MRVRARSSLAHASCLAAFCVLAACTKDDLGNPCPQMVVPHQGKATTNGDLERTEGSEVVEYNTEFPCRDIVCVATLGRGSYCTHECDSDADCPRAFVCREVTKEGPFVKRKYCVWRACQTDEDCGDPWVMACSVVPELGLTEEVRLCELR
jgi:hypothetical protein